MCPARAGAGLEIQAILWMLGLRKWVPVTIYFEAVTRFTPEEKKIAKALIESLILKHDSVRFSRAS